MKQAVRRDELFGVRAMQIPGNAAMIGAALNGPLQNATNDRNVQQLAEAVPATGRSEDAGQEGRDGREQASSGSATRGRIVDISI